MSWKWSELVVVFHHAKAVDGIQTDFNDLLPERIHVL